MQVNIKKVHPNAVVPEYSKYGDAGMDLTAVSKKYDEYGNVCYGTGLAMEIPLGHVGLVFPRSSIYSKPFDLSNAVGVIDSGYRGEIKVKFKPTPELISENIGRLDDVHDYKAMHFPRLITGSEYQVGDRVAQIIILPYPQIEFNLVKELTDTERGSDGYGSTGK